MKTLLKLLILSDLHIGAGDGEIEAAMELAEYIIATYDPDTTLIAITGDGTDNASDDEIHLLSVLIQCLRDAGFTVIVIPGNHDQGWGGVSRQAERIARWQSNIHPAGYPHETVWQGWRVLMLDSCAGAGYGSLAQGTLGSEQIAWLASQMMSAERTLLFLHHKPWWKKPSLLLTDADEFLTLTRRARGRLVVVCGHRHEHQVWHGRDGAELVVNAGKCTEWHRPPKTWRQRLAFWRKDTRPRWLEFEEVDLSAPVATCRKVRLE